MKCAKCSHKMETFEVDGIEIDKCPECSGIWCDQGEYEKLLITTDIRKLLSKVDKNKGHNEKKAPCPRCSGKEKMVQVPSVNPDIKIDKCTKCNGIWLDGGEFEVLQIDEVMDKLENLFG